MPYNEEEGWEVSRGKAILLLIESEIQALCQLELSTRLVWTRMVGFKQQSCHKIGLQNLKTLITSQYVIWHQVSDIQF